MKKEVILPFPKFDERNERNPKANMEEIPVRPGMLFRIGRPSNLYYEFVYASLHFDRHKLSDLKKLLQFQGIEVQVVSILKMKDGSTIASLSRTDGKTFSETVTKLFADISKSIRAKELLG
ncbi:hypothetical protein [Ulvibacterium sp.]|uniref:hypothetical protein n=1 Tax=Ulvibacterium sp. TaxID=2665914 RepID=UPI0026086C3B|nr:hypothetical protein [Ulvibacterium sp.]